MGGGEKALERGEQAQKGFGVISFRKFNRQTDGDKKQQTTKFSPLSRPPHWIVKKEAKKDEKERRRKGGKSQSNLF